MFRLLLSSLILIALFTGSARSDFLIDLSGTASSGSTFTPSGGSANPLTGLFDVQAVISGTASSTPGTGIGVYDTISLTASIGGTTYTLANPANGSVTLVDPTSTYANYGVAISGNNGANYFFPLYDSTLPTLDPTSPGTTSFSNYLGSYGNDATLTFTTTTNGILTLNYDYLSGGPSATIQAVPEPDSRIYLLEACLLGLGLAVVKRVEGC